MATTVDKTFESATLALKEAVKEAADGASVGRVPLLKTDHEGSATIDGADHEKLAALFSREATAKAYAESIVDGSSYKDAMLARIEGDQLSAYERDIRMRYRSRVRMMAHSAARQVIHGQAGGPVLASLRLIREMLDRGDADES